MGFFDDYEGAQQETTQPTDNAFSDYNNSSLSMRQRVGLDDASGKPIAPVVETAPSGRPRITIYPPAAKMVAPTVTTGQAAVQGFTDTSTMGLLPVILGLKAAGEAGLSQEQKSAIMPAGVASEAPGLEMLGHGLGRLQAGDPAAHQAFQDATAQAVQANSQAFTQHPLASIGGAIPGAALSLPATGAAGGAGFVARLLAAMRTGAVYGSTYGAGSTISRDVAQTGTTTPGSVAEGAAIGGGTGAATGAVAAGVGGTARAGIGYVAQRAQRLFNPEGAAMEAASGAIAQDVQSGSANAVRNPAGLVAEHQTGTPIMAADLGGEATRDTLRSAANVSSEVRQGVTDTLNERARTLPQRARDFVAGLSPFGGNAARAQRVIEQTGSAVNNAAYTAARNAADARFPGGMWSDELERLASNQDVGEAIQTGIRQSAGRLGASGGGQMRPSVTFENGRLTYQRAGRAAFPDWQTWDYTYRALRDGASAAFRAGRNNEGGYLSQMARDMRAELDRMVPEGAQARGGARFFNSMQDALDYGQGLVRSDLNQARIDLARMSPEERQMVAEGFVSSLADQVGRTTNPLTRSGLISRLVNTPDGQQRIALALGGNRGAELEAFLRRNEMLNLTRDAMGNSSTWRQAMQHALSMGHGAAGTGGTAVAVAAGEAAREKIFEGEMSPKKIMIAAVAGGMLLSGRVIDYNFSTRLGEILSSEDPTVQARLFSMARNSREVRQALLGAETFMEQTAASMGGVAGSHAVVPMR